MTVTVEPVARPAPAPSRAATALARAEARRMRLSPLLWAGMMLSIALGTAWGWTRMPSWDTFHENAGMSSLVLAAALLIGSQLAAGRDRRAGAEESTVTMPAGPGRRSLALLVTVPIAALAGVVVYAAELLLMLPAWPVGRFQPWAAATVVVIPAIGAALGVLVGRRFSGLAAGPLAVAALVIALIALLAMSQTSDSVLSHLFPVLLVIGHFGVPVPFGWHLLYLVGLLTLAVAAVSWPASRKAAAVVAIAAVAVSGYSVQRQAAATPDVVDADEALNAAPQALDCRMHEGVRYCALPGYGPWIQHWREAVKPVAEVLPANAQKPSLRQIADMDNFKPMTPGYPELVIGDSWGRTGGWAEDSRQRLTRSYVATAVGVLRRDNVLSWRSCDGAGQHRTVVGLWLLAQAAPGKAYTLPRIRYGQAEIQAAASLQAKPPGEVSAYLAKHWAEVLDPSATALAGLGVTLKPPPIPTGAPALPEGEASSDDAGVCR